MISSENIYLLGAGFTKAAYPKTPLNNELLDAIIDTGGTKISAYQKKYKAKDIERLLTQIDLDGFHDEKIRKDRQAIESEISAFFSNFRFEVLNGQIPSWLDTFSRKILRQNDSIINLNYDCMLEGVLDYLGVWTPRDGYARISACGILTKLGAIMYGRGFNMPPPRCEFAPDLGYIESLILKPIPV